MMVVAETTIYAGVLYAVWRHADASHHRRSLSAPPTILIVLTPKNWAS